MFTLSTTARPDQCVVSSNNHHWDTITYSSLQHLVRTLITYWEYMALLPGIKLETTLKPKMICTLINGISGKPQINRYASISLVAIFNLWMDLIDLYICIMITS